MRAQCLAFCGLLLLLPGLLSAQSPPTAGLGCPSPLPAHTFCVTTTADSGAGSLRQAILDSDTAGGANTIDFEIPGAGPHTITLASQMPTINFSGTVTSLLVDGYSQPGSVLNTNTPDQGGLNTKLMIDIAGPGGVYGFNYYCCPFPKIDLTYQGLAMSGFMIAIAGQSYGFTPKAQLSVYGNFLGTTVDGTGIPAQRNLYGVYFAYDDAQIGGVQPWQRNLISATNGDGIYGGAPGDSVVIEGNLIGTDVSGTQAIANTAGVSLGGDLPNVRVGCSGAGCIAAGHPSRNVISGNSNLGILVGGSIGGATSGLQITGNFIGTDRTGAQPLPNGSNSYGCPIYCGGVGVQTGAAPPSTVIGGFNPGEANVIAYNHGAGILSLDARIEESFDNRGNAIHNNTLADVAFGPTGWTANDPGDADTGANSQQNYPVIQSASVSGNQLTVKYLVDTDVANATYPLRVDFYVDIDEGRGAFLVSDSYPSASAGMPRTVTLALPASALSLTGFVASATTADGYSSQLSPSYVFDRIFADRFEGH